MMLESWKALRADSLAAAQRPRTTTSATPVTAGRACSNVTRSRITSYNVCYTKLLRPADDGYGTPSGTIWGDANGDGVFDNRNALLNLPVQKYGRTTKLTTGTVTGVNATLTICYEALFGIFCLKSARFA